MLPSRDLLQILNTTCASLNDEKSLDTLAEHSGWSKFYLHRTFSHELGETPKQFVNRLRLERSAAMLISSSKPILDIAMEVGFSSHEVFSRAFQRKFECSPSDYRKFKLTLANASERENHAALVGSIGPCTGLFYCSTKKRRKIKMSTSEIVRKEIEHAQPIIYLQTRAAHTDFASVFPECIGRVYTHAMSKGLAIAGHPIARYASSGPGLWTVEFAVPLSHPADDDAVDGEFRAGTLHQGMVAYAEHKGPYEELPSTNAAIEKWIEENGYRVSGAPWEYYKTDPTEVPDPNEWITEVYWPIDK